jgi:DNA-binding MarR family transcriptional regulator
MLCLEVQIVLRRINQAIDIWSRQLWHDHGLTSPQLATLRQVLAGQNISPGTLATALHMSQPTVTGILGRLEQRGLVSRHRSTIDRRSTIAIATEEGKQLAMKAPPLLRDRFRDELAKLPDWRHTEILAALQHVAQMMHAPEMIDTPFLFHDADPALVKKRRRAAKSKVPPENTTNEPLCKRS